MSLATDTPARVAESTRLRHMKATALVFLVVAAAVFLVSFSVPDSRGLGFIRAAAEAAMVGGLADWFAVTALFRRPLGLPIPHTALIPRQKDRLATALGGYVTSTFLSSTVVGPYLAKADPVGRGAAWMLIDDHPEVVGRQVAMLLASALENMQAANLAQGLLEAGQRSHAETPLAPFAGRLLGAVVAERTHEPLVQLMLAEAHHAVTQHRGALSDWLFHTVEPSNIITYFAVSPGTARGWVQSGQAELVKAQQDQQHWVHALIQDLLEKLSVDLRESHELAVRFDDKITALLHDAGLAKWLEELVSEGLAAGSRDLQDPHGIFVREVSSYLRSLAQRTLDDPTFRKRLDAGLQHAVEQVLAENRNAFTDLVQHVIAGLEGSVVTRQVELAAGRDLQFIRINGTVVGALAGLAIHTVGVALG